MRGGSSLNSWISLDYSYIKGEALEETQARIASIIGDWWSSVAFEQTNVAFESHIILFHAPSNVKEYYLDPRSINPYEDRLVLCYRIHKARHKIELLGTLQAREHMQTDGYFIEASLLRTRRAKIPESPSNSMGGMEEGELFYFPVSNMDRIRELVPSEDMMRHALEKRITWHLACFEKNEVTLPLEMTTEEDVVSMIMMQLVFQAMEFISENEHYVTACIPKVRVAFSKIFLKAEKHRFLSKFARLRTEFSIIDLIDFNRLLGGIKFVRAEKLDPLDFQCFYNRFGDDPLIQPPTLFFSVPLEEVPYTLAKDLPLHAGMQLHLSYLDVALWVWNVYEIQLQRYGTMMQRDAPIKQWVTDLAKRILLFKPKGSETPSRRNHVRIDGGPIDPKAGFTTSTRDLIECMPPCMKNVVTHHFPRNTERMTLIPALREAGVSLETAVNLFDNLNNRYPSFGGAVDLKVRFDVAALWKRPQGATFCKRIVERTVKNASDQLHCPFVEKTKEHSSIPNCGECKRAAGISPIEDMYAPHLFLRHKLMAKAEQEPADKKLKEDDCEMEALMSSSEEDEDAWAIKL